ncbi:HD domain-containing protein [Halobacillus litoralis]|uniref:HD-GYP domain-containing protein n=1 Tax=Halobacillus litoralis TaxID=45668 RepID=UPI001CD1DEA4|nr:HD domain-containing phosphohydrolase [Halobacillus litoralis]MCA0971684.1 HD domain-containing protein [Halobacillus litoralis]
MSLKLHPKELSTDHILAEDLYRNNTLVLPKGTKISNQHINKFINWKIELISVTDTSDPEPPPNQVEKNKQKEESQEERFLRKLFHQEIVKFVKETRYGELLKPTQTLKEAQNLFINVLKRPSVKRLLMNLFHHDEYTFTHSLDVFILGYFIGRKVLKEDIESFATSCLLHDIGKLQVPGDVLKKQTKLTEYEFDMIQNHTIKGQNLLDEEGFELENLNLARSHHEKLKGSGYPDQLHEDVDHFSDPLRLLMIIDVYSALTLDRPYRDAFSAPKALTILLSEQEDYDQRMLYTFINTLKIFPAKSLVRLSDRQIGEVIEVTHSLPTLSTIRIEDKTFQLPVDQSLYIEEIVSWDEKKDTIDERNWNRFIQSLLYEDDNRALQSLSELEDGYQIEEVFENLFTKAVKEMEQKERNKEVKRSQRLLALPKLRRIMGIKSNEYSQAITTEQEAIMLLSVGEKGEIRTHILADLLLSTGYKVDLIEVNDLNELPLEDLSDYFSDSAIRKLIVTGTHTRDVEHLPEALKEKIPSLMAVRFLNEPLVQSEIYESYDLVTHQNHELFNYLVSHAKR